MWNAVKAIWRGASTLSTITWLWGLLPAGAVGVLTGAWALFAGMPRPTAALIAVAFGVVIYIGYVAFVLHRRTEGLVESVAAAKAAPQAEELKELPKIEQLFFRDFQRGPRGTTAQINYDQGLALSGGPEITIRYVKALLYDANALVLGFYIPQTHVTTEIALHVLSQIDQYTAFEGPDPAIGGVGHEEVRASELVFTRKVFIYHEAALTLTERGKLDEAFRAKGIRLQLRSSEYALHTKVDDKDDG